MVSLPISGISQSHRAETKRFTRCSVIHTSNYEPSNLERSQNVSGNSNSLPPRSQSLPSRCGAPPPRAAPRRPGGGVYQPSAQPQCFRINKRSYFANNGFADAVDSRLPSGNTRLCLCGGPGAATGVPSQHVRLITAVSSSPKAKNLFLNFHRLMIFFLVKSGLGISL